MTRIILGIDLIFAWLGRSLRTPTKVNRAFLLSWNGGNHHRHNHCHRNLHYIGISRIIKISYFILYKSLTLWTSIPISSMDGGELFARIEESQGFCERGRISKKTFDRTKTHRTNIQSGKSPWFRIKYSLSWRPVQQRLDPDINSQIAEVDFWIWLLDLAFGFCFWI